MSQFEKNKKRVFSEKLKELVKGWEKANNKKLSQEKLGRELFVTRETVSGWYNCKTIPSEETQKRLCAFFNVPEWYFTRNGYDKGWTEIDEKTHDDLENDCLNFSTEIGLSIPFVAFLKENPIIADAIVAASWVDAYSQSLSPSVPLMPDKVFQFVSSSNIKIYPSQEVLYMLRVVQRDLSEYALFLIQKWSKIIENAHTQETEGKEMNMSAYGWRTKSGDEYTPALDRFALELKGRGSLTTGSSFLVDMYNNMTGTDQEELLELTRKAYRKSRKKNPQAQKTRKAIRKAIETNTPVQPLEKILEDINSNKT